MLNDDSIYFIWGEDKPGVAIGFVIGKDLVYDLPAWKTFFDMLIEMDDVIDISEQYPEHNGLTVQFMKNNKILEKFQTTEYFGSVLLSNPLIVDLNQYENGDSVITPAKFINNVFVQA